MEVEVISRETIKPSSPTPPHLRNFKISFLDQVAPTTYVPFVLFYPPTSEVADINMEETLARLKKSLSEALTLYYPLAGRVSRTDSSLIDCNDEGALFVVARVYCCMKNILMAPKVEIFHNMGPEIPPVCPVGVSKEPAQVAIQLNIYKCGGLAMCICGFHRILDGITAGGFLKCWAAMARGKTDVIIPDFPGASIFPPKQEPIPPRFSFPADISMQRRKKSFVRRFNFDAAAVSGIRDMATSKRMPNPSRSEALTCFIWKQAMAACRSTVKGAKTPSILGLVTDLRRRMVPPLSEYSGGNLCWKFCTLYDEEVSDDGQEVIKLDFLVGLLRGSLEKNIATFVPNLKRDGEDSDGALGKYFDELRRMYSVENVIPFTVSSWCSMRFSELDFGWGKAAWLSMFGDDKEASRPNGFFLLEGQFKDDIEAWVILGEAEMAFLESDPEFFRFASQNPGLSIPGI